MLLRIRDSECPATPLRRASSNQGCTQTPPSNRLNKRSPQNGNRNAERPRPRPFPKAIPPERTRLLDGATSSRACLRSRTQPNDVDSSAFADPVRALHLGFKTVERLSHKPALHTNPNRSRNIFRGNAPAATPAPHRLSTHRPPPARARTDYQPLLKKCSRPCRGRNFRVAISV